MGKETGMKRYVAELEEGGAKCCAAITQGVTSFPGSDQRAGSVQLRRGRVQRAVRSTGREIAGLLRISARRVDRVKNRFVEDGLEGAFWGPGRAVMRNAFARQPAFRGAPRLAQSRRSAREVPAVVAAPVGAVELSYVDSGSHETRTTIPPAPGRAAREVYEY